MRLFYQIKNPPFRWVLKYGQYRVRTCDLPRVRRTRYHCANCPKIFCCFVSNSRLATCSRGPPRRTNLCYKHCANCPKIFCCFVSNSRLATCSRGPPRRTNLCYKHCANCPKIYNYLSFSIILIFYYFGNETYILFGPLSNLCGACEFDIL